MHHLYFVLILLLAACLAFIARPLTVLLHEFGHALPALLLTRKKVTVYIGSYGEPAKKLKFSSATLDVHFTNNPIFWRSGLCVPSADAVSVNRQIIYTVTGPLTSLAIAGTACFISFNYDLHGSLKLFLIVFLGSALADLLMNLVPNNTPILLHNGTTTYNDGYSLQQLFQYRKHQDKYTRAATLYNNHHYSEAVILFEQLISETIDDEALYRAAIYCYSVDKKYEKATELAEAFAKTGKMNADDLCNVGVYYTNLCMPEKSIEFYDKSLQLNPDHHYSLNNKGYSLILLSRYEDAIPLLDKAIELDNNFSHAYDNRGLAKIKTGKPEEGLKDLNHALELDPENAYVYRNLGIYHFEKNEYAEALQLFEKSKELDATTQMIDELIHEATVKVSAV